MAPLLQYLLSHALLLSYSVCFTHIQSRVTDQALYMLQRTTYPRVMMANYLSTFWMLHSAQIPGYRDHPFSSYPLLSHDT